MKLENLLQMVLAMPVLMMPQFSAEQFITFKKKVLKANFTI